MLRPPEPTGTGRGYRPPRPPEKRGGRSSASRYRRPKQPSLGTRLLSRQGASCLPTARQREKASAEPFYLANAKEVRNALRIGERSVFRSTPADLRRGETDSMFIFREDLEIKIKFGKKKKKKGFLCKPRSAGSCRSAEAGEEEGGSHRHHAARATPLPASRRNEQGQGDVPGHRERAAEPAHAQPEPLGAAPLGDRRQARASKNKQPQKIKLF